MKKITLICGHPNLSISVGNKLILAELQAHFGEKINIRQLDSLYPNAHFDVAAEQASLVEADIIVWQFPMYWYNVPALLKKWIDDVLLHNFAYGSKGDKLQGKKLILSFTTGGGADEYDGNHAHKINAFYPAFMDTAKLCGMDWQEPVYSHSVLYIEGVSRVEDLPKVQAIAKEHAKRLIARLESL
ncbi:hypothetical protein BKK52_04985 [Rodentibacter trehalosifermentans]|uniref:Flavodoxin-like fold domain-containing protein n=1 Tax=Rodentibacter trehalosifermentans TaxID=1908263 RepID=A0A1V3J1C8_9PAST|nr:NAD(P)H-dependent oxidoreductase [Rodentibacter trehalosifermentans]OOF48767.1 hypothetical protein BKK52_04985 [Rodentibacter trehalosifermentans]